MQLAKLIDELENEKKDIEFILSLVNQVHSLPVAEIDRLQCSRDRLRCRIQSIDQNITSLKLSQARILRRTQILSGVLYAVALVNVLQLVVGSEWLTSIFACVVLVFVLLFACWRFAPLFKWQRIVVSILLSLFIVILCASIPITREFMNQQGNLITSFAAILAVISAFFLVNSSDG